MNKMRPKLKAGYLDDRLTAERDRRDHTAKFDHAKAMANWKAAALPKGWTWESNRKETQE